MDRQQLPPKLLLGSNQPQEDDEPFFNVDLSRYLHALRRYVWVLLALFALAITGAVLFTQRQTKLYEATASVQIDPRLPDLLGQGNEMLAAGGTTGTTDYYKQQLRLLSSYMLVRQTVERNNLASRLLTEQERTNLRPEEQLDRATRQLTRSMIIHYPDQNRTMYVTVRRPSPVDAAEFANAHIATYEAFSRGQITSNTEMASGALASEFTQADQRLRDAEDKLLEFRKTNEMIDLSAESQQTLVETNIASFTQKVGDARGRRIELGARLERLRKAAQLDVLESPLLTITEVGSFDSLRAQYYEERNAMKALARELGPKAPEFQKQKEKVDDLLLALQSEHKRQLAGAEEQYQAAFATERSLMAEVDRFKKEAAALGPRVLKYNELRRNRDDAADDRKRLVGRLSTSEMAGRLNKDIKSNVHPLDPALVPTKPMHPSMRKNIMVASAGALVLGLALILLLVFLDRTIKTTEDAQQAAGVPVLGVIPALAEGDLPRNDDKARDLYVHEHPTSNVAECCRSLRTNIMFSAAEKKLKTLVVSSASPREGKTTSVIYLGTTIAQSGQRVLLIDTDMRRPRLHASTGVARNSGLSNLILGDDNYDEVIRKTDIPNLFVLPCGPLPPNPAELLMTKRFQVVLEELGKRFDRILLDSPPLQAVTDAVVLAKQVDGAILVVRAGKTEREEIRRSAKQMRNVDANIFGVIVNELDSADRGAYYYSYYGYGQDEASKAS